MDQQPDPPAPPAGAPQTTPDAPARPARNTIGLIALIAAGVGFVFACIPGAVVIGWLLLPVGLILGIVAVAQRNKTKGTGIAAIVVSVVGTIVGFVVFLVVVGDAVSDAFDDAFDDSFEVVEPTATAGTEAPDDPDPQADVEPTAGGTADETTDDSAAAGTRADPLPFDSVVNARDWTIALTGFDADADARVAAANMFNDQPTDGTVWITVDLEATFTGDDSGSTLGLDVAFVAADGTVTGQSDAMAAGLDGEFDRFAELYEGATESGPVALLVPDDLDGLIRVTPGLFATDVFFALP